MKKAILLMYLIFTAFFTYAEEECKSSFAYREIAIDLGGDSKPEKIVYFRDTVCTGGMMWCGIRGCRLEVYDDNGVNQKNYLAENDWYIRPSEMNLNTYNNPTENAFELIIPMYQSYCSENHGKENCSRVVKVKNNKITESYE
tara:strand:+ start:120 stop:548 length:429 start_codon:yes stop_codon:yes gene_type:complete